MHGFQHWLSYWLGLTNPAGPIYALYSGSLGVLLQVLGQLGVAVLFWRRHNCHAPWCVRLGKHQLGPYKVCRKHHPGLPNRLRLHHIHSHH